MVKYLRKSVVIKPSLVGFISPTVNFNKLVNDLLAKHYNVDLTASKAKGE